MKFRNLLLTCLLLSSCKTSSYPFRLNEEYYSKNELKELTSIDEFLDLENNNYSFGIYIYLPGCSSCISFKPIIEEYINDSNITLFTISYLKVKTKDNTLLKKVKYTPSVALFHEGNLEVFLDSGNDEHTEAFKSKDKFKEWFETYIEIK